MDLVSEERKCCLLLGISDPGANTDAFWLRLGKTVNSFSLSILLIE